MCVLMVVLYYKERKKKKERKEEERNCMNEKCKVNWLFVVGGGDDGVVVTIVEFLYTFLCVSMYVFYVCVPVSV